MDVDVVAADVAEASLATEPVAEAEPVPVVNPPVWLAQAACHVCLDTMWEPVLLPACGHSFCEVRRRAVDALPATPRALTRPLDVRAPDPV